jgi:predicted PurR-regulated permease PerM
LVVLDDPTRFGWILIATVVFVALAHVVMAYLFHFADPAVKNQIEINQKISTAIERGKNNALAQIDAQIDAMSQKLADSIVYQAEQQLNSQTAVHLRQAYQIAEKAGETARGGDVVDGLAVDAPPEPKKKRLIFTPMEGKN